MAESNQDRTRLITDQRGAVLLITLDGPKSRNSVGPLIYPELQSLMIEAGQDPNTQAVVITGAAGFFRRAEISMHCETAQVALCQRPQQTRMA